MLLVAFLVPESPKWSQSKGRFDEMKRSLTWIDRFNGDPSVLEDPFPVMCDSQGSINGDTSVPEDPLPVTGVSQKSSNGDPSAFEDPLPMTGVSQGKITGDPSILGSPLPITGVSERNKAEKKDTVKKNAYTIKDLFATKQMRIQTFTMMTMWFTASLSSYCNDLNSRTLAGSFFVNQFLMGLLLALGSPLVFFMDFYLPRFNRRTLHQVPQLLVVLLFMVIIILYIFNIDGTPITVLNLIGTVMIQYTWDACYVCGAEGFPTIIRTLGLGTSSVMARIGGILAPQTAYLGNMWAPAPFATVAGVGLVSLLVSWKFLPDTKGMELRGQIGDMAEGKGGVDKR